MKKYHDIKLLNQMAFPIMLNYVMSVLFEILDKAVVGNYSTIGLAAIGVGSKIIYLITGTLGVLSVAYNIIGADKIGKADFEGFKKLFQTMITLYVPLFVQDFFETTLFSSIIISIATKGGTYITAAYSLLETFGEIILLPTFAYATVATTLAIQYHSSSRKQQENRIIQTAIVISVGMVILLGLITLAFPRTILGFVSPDGDLISMTSKVIPIVILVQVINSVLQVMKSYLQGIGFEKSILLITIPTSMVSIIWINSLMNQWSLNGLYIGICICYLIILVGFILKLREKKT